MHISTQVNVSNSEAVRFYSQWADVMVMARELNLDQVRKIHETIVSDQLCGPHGKPVRIEMFCHGALCMAVSGKCYLSLHETGASANRGACRQICRRGYVVTDRETGDELAIDNKYIMSPKDLKTIHFLNKMVDAGVRVFKIEGRARGPEYVRTVVSCYNEALNAIVDGTYGNEEQIQQWDERLSRVLDLVGGEKSPDHARFLELCRKALKPIPYHDIQGTCGRDDECECRSCWVRRGGYNRPRGQGSENFGKKPGKGEQR